MKVLLTGGTGYIGYKIAHTLYKKYNFTLLVRKNSLNRWRLEDLQGKVCVAEYESYQDFNSFFEYHCFDCLLHLAATYRGTEEQTVENNLYFPSLLVSSYVRHAVHARIINTSTFFIDDQNGAYHPTSLYVATKKAFEDVLSYYALEGKAKVNTLRLYDVYGVDDWRGKIYQVIINAIQNGQPLRLTSGLEWMNHVSIDDVVRAFDCALQRLNAKTSNDTQQKQEFFEVRSQETLQLRQVVEILQEVMGKKTQVEWGAFPNPKERPAGKPSTKGELPPGWQTLDDLRTYYQRELTL